MRIELSSGPLNEAIAKLERIAAIYERIGAAQGTVAAGPTRGGGGGGGTVRGGGGGGGRVVSGKSTVGGRGGGGGGGLVENLMRSNPGLTREQASVMAGNLPGEAARTPAFTPDYQRIGQEAVGSLRRQRQLKSLANREAERLVNDEYKSIVQERRAQFGGGGGGGGGRGRGGIGGGPGRSGQPFFRERLRIAGTGLVGGIGGPWALAAAAVYGFVSALRGAVQSVDDLHKAALVTGGSMQEVARLRSLGVNATEANALRARMATDPFTIMSMGYMPDPRFGGPQNNAALMQTAVQRLRRLRGNPNAQLQEARRMGVGEDELRAANLGERAYQETVGMGRFAPNRKQAEDIVDTQQHLSNIWQRIEFGFGRLLPKMFSRRSPGDLIGDIREAFSPNAPEKKGPDSPQGTMDANTRALNDLASVIQTTNRAMAGRGMQDRGAFPSALFGTELMRGIRGGAIRMGAFH
jgi:hypothetical protein